MWLCVYCCSCKGIPRLDVTEEEILQLKSLNYSWAKIADMLQVSRQTLYRRLEEFGIDSEKFTSISEQDLDTALIRRYQKISSIMW